eukprot:753721-Hanusia_phi.AAC.1
MPTQKQSKGGKSAEKSAPTLDEHAALEEERMQVISAWMYEHCSRYGLDEALQGLIQSMSRKFHITHEKLAEKADPIGQLRRWIEAREFNLALREFDFICTEDDLEKSPGSVFWRAFNELKIQAALKDLKSDMDLEQFRQNVQILFPWQTKNKQDENYKEVNAFRSDSLSISKKDLPKLFAKYPVEKLDLVMKEFWVHLASTQKPTMLEIIARDISCGKYAPSFSKSSDSKQVLAEEGNQKEGDDSQIAQAPVQEEPKAARRSRHNEKKDDVHKGDQSGSIEQKSKEAVNAVAELGKTSEDKEGSSRSYFDMSAWDLRDALRLACGRDDEGDWTEIHQKDSEDVQIPDEAEPAAAKMPTSKTTESAATTTRSKAAQKAESDDEVEFVQPKSRAAKKHRVQQEDGSEEENISSGGKENANPRKSSRTTPKKTARDVSAEDANLIKTLREKRSDLLSKGKDPLDDVLQQSNSTTTSKSPEKPRRIDFLNPPDEGRTMHWDTDDESEEGIKLATPKNDYRPKDFTTLDSTPQKRKADAAGKGYIRWTTEEEETLKKGIERSGLGFDLGGADQSVRYGPSKWTMILSNFDFHPSRTAVDLKDKWRNLQK